MKGGKKAVHTAELLALVGLASCMVCTCRRVDCNSVIGNVNIGVGYTCRVDSCIDKVTTVARGK